MFSHSTFEAGGGALVPDQVPAVRLTSITKRFPGVVANRDINLTIERGEVHALCGENGAGKSTLMKILYGMQKPDEGTIEVDGGQVSFKSPADAIGRGIGMVHQHFKLADNLTVLENVILGAEPRGALGIDFRAARAKIKEMSKAYGLRVDPDVLVETLGVGERQRVEILKVLYRGARVLILDEPTAVLVPQEVEELFGNLRDLRSEGLTVLFISHKLDEVLAVADTISVIRRGTTVQTRLDPREVTSRRLAELMVGSELPTPELRESTVTEDVQLDVAKLTVLTPEGRPVVDDVSLRIRRGEIVGLAGVEGNGQTELIEAVMGIRNADAGTIGYGGDDITQWATRKRREAGIAYIPEDRHRHGLVLEGTLWENRMLGHQTQRPNVRGPWVDRRGARRDTTRIVQEYDVRTPGIDVPAAALSGGNQQKLIVGREMSGDPHLLIAAHPTRGIDVGAQAAIWEYLRQARADGLAVLLISADLEELIGMSDTLHVILRGRLVAEVDPRTVTPEELGSAMTGAGAPS
ncbi:ABC transporter ATP-binding protein [Actinomadura darangshiensis]|uniref:ABC transporter ATP-binding protein n=1 Tax=Actinomadura darangshiensis TaxID=705336 RepID=A0A4R5AGP6_9ACTN|nr:ABC transporter ATP-binding protein [Actinomadura darangshiensis]TDD71803.1 ABC transporter ATP-binding protein [Actinomadura darangshiensis]